MDFAGSTVVHSVGGWAALVGVVILGPRLGKYKDGGVVPMLGSNLPLATLGTFILWLGWFGFNGGSQLAMGSIGEYPGFLSTQIWRQPSVRLSPWSQPK
jgi:Amt family ammonium transporter